MNIQKCKHIERKKIKKLCQTNSNHKNGGVAILISSIIDFKIKDDTRDKEGCFILMKGSIHQEHIMIIYALSDTTKIHEAIRTEIKGEIGNSTIII